MQLKIEIISGFLETCGSVAQFSLLFYVVDQIVVFIGFLIYTLKYKTHPMSLKCIAYFKDLPIYNKFVFICFTIFCAIPNKIYVNNGINGFFVSFSIFLLIVLSHIFPALILIYLMFWVLVAESYFFALAYESISVYRNFINKHLFNGDTKFAKEYFSFFWGNMSKGGSSRGKLGIFGSLVGTVYSGIRIAESRFVRAQGKIETYEYYERLRTQPKNVDEFFKLRDQMEDKIIDKETVVLKAEKRVQEIGGEIVKLIKDSI